MKSKILDVKINIDVFNESVFGEKSNWSSCINYGFGLEYVQADTKNKYDTENALQAIVKTFNALNTNSKVKLITNSPIVYSFLNKDGYLSYEYIELSRKVKTIKRKHSISCFMK